MTRDDNPVIQDLQKVVDKYGGPEAVNRAAAENGRLESLLQKVKRKNPHYADDLAWLADQKDRGTFISMEEFRNKIGAPAPQKDGSWQVTLEISALQYFPWLMTEARQAIRERELMPGRFIRFAR